MSCYDIKYIMIYYDYIMIYQIYYDARKIRKIK